MAKGSGIGSRMALRKAGTVWGVPTNTNVANAGIDYLSEDMGFGIPEMIDDASVSRSWASDPFQGNVSVNGTIRAYDRYLGLEYILASTLGVAAVSAVATGVKRHRYTYTSNVYGNFATLAIDKGVSVHEFESIKFSGYTVTGQNGRATEITARALCNNNVVPGVVNTTLAAATFRTTGDHVLFKQYTLLIAAKAGAAPTSTTDRYNPGSFELTYDRTLSEDHVMDGSDEMIEPILNANPTANLRLTFPRYATAPAGTPGNVFMVWAKAKTPLKLILRAVGATITGTSQRFRQDLYAGNAFVSAVVSNVGGPQEIPQEVTLMLKSTPSVPTGLPAWLGSGGFAIGATTSVQTAPF